MIDGEALLRSSISLRRKNAGSARSLEFHWFGFTAKFTLKREFLNSLVKGE